MSPARGGRIEAFPELVWRVEKDSASRGRHLTLRDWDSLLLGGREKSLTRFGLNQISRSIYIPAPRALAALIAGVLGAKTLLVVPAGSRP